MSWETSFVAMSAALGVDPEDALACVSSVRDPEATRLAGLMKSASKTQRAQAMALGLGPIAREIAAVDLEGDA